MSSLHAKLAWSVLQGNSLWEKFAQTKYGGLNGYVSPLTACHVWKAIVCKCLQFNSVLGGL